MIELKYENHSIYIMHKHLTHWTYVDDTLHLYIIGRSFAFDITPDTSFNLADFKSNFNRNVNYTVRGV